MFEESYIKHPHTIEFSENSLKFIMIKNGFSIIKCSTHGEKINHKNNLIFRLSKIINVFFKRIINNRDPWYSTENGANIRAIFKKIS